MDLNLIGIFVEIVESRSLSAAARKLGMTRANISHRLKLLEIEAGAQLLRRSPRSIELTQAGHMLYDCGQRMLDDLSMARASIDSLGKTLSGRVRLSVPTGFGRMFASAKLLEFARAHPGITLNVMFNNRIQDLIAAEVDVALRITAKPPLDCVARHICSIVWNVYASADYVEKHGPIEHPSELQKHTMVAWPFPGKHATVTLTNRLDSADIHTVVLQPSLHSTDYPFLAEAVCQGMGIGVLPAYVPYALKDRGLVHILPQYRVEAPETSLYILTLPNRYPSPSTQALIDYLRNEILSLAQAWT